MERYNDNVAATILKVKVKTSRVAKIRKIHAAERFEKMFEATLS